MTSAPTTAAEPAAVARTTDRHGSAAPCDGAALAAARAFTVAIGPAVVLDAAAAASIVSTARAVSHGRRPHPLAAIGTALAALYAVGVRPWMRRWGATPAETSAALPGDELVPEPARQLTHAVTIAAPVEQVWPWLAQIGQDRAGFYSYESLENLAGCRMTNADAVHPEWQHRAPGETVYLHPLHGMPVARFEPDRVIALEGWGAFVLRELPDGRTRLLARSRTPRGPATLYWTLLIEIPHFVMQRKMLLGIRERAEAAVARRGRG